jgi:adenine-specific DNA methylase
VPGVLGEVVFWEAAVDKEAGKVRDEFACPHCSALLKKKGLGRAWETRYDEALGDTVSQARQVPVMINYSVGKKRFEKSPDDFDRAMISAIEVSPVSHWFPTDRMPEGEESRRNDDIGLTHVHHFYTKRNLHIFSSLFNRAESMLIECALLGGYTLGLKTARFLPLRWINKDTGPMKPHTAGTLYVPSLKGEQNWFNIFRSRIIVARRASQNIQTFTERNTLACNSASDQAQPNESVDYIFTDPPFGGNLMYSELNYLWEAWLKVCTDNEPEAIENKVQGKGLLKYQEIMTRCFEEYHRVLKPGRWMTVEFHNSKNSVWNAIQESLQRAGFVVADVRTLDKKQGTFKRTTSAAAVKQDLIISAYKPNQELERRFELEAGTESGVWDFVESHHRLAHLSHAPSSSRRG